MSLQCSDSCQLNMVRQFQFVSASEPTGHVSSESRKMNHSHVMRHVHAKKRRLRTQRHQDEYIGTGREQVSITSEMGSSSPLIQRFANSKDPFTSLARPLLPEEYFLLDHCTWESPYTILRSPSFFFSLWEHTPCLQRLTYHATHHIPSIIVNSI